MADQAFYAFNDVHALMAFVGAQRSDLTSVALAALEHGLHVLLEGDQSAHYAAYWFEHQPHNVIVFRDAAQRPAGFLLVCANAIFPNFNPTTANQHSTDVHGE